MAEEWREWFYAPSPVPADQRVECVLYDGRRAQGVAVAFNWRDGRRSDVVERWRPATPREGIIEPPQPEKLRSS